MAGELGLTDTTFPTGPSWWPDELVYRHATPARRLLAERRKPKAELLWAGTSEGTGSSKGYRFCRADGWQTPSSEKQDQGTPAGFR